MASEVGTVGPAPEPGGRRPLNGWPGRGRRSDVESGRRWSEAPALTIAPYPTDPTQLMAGMQDSRRERQALYL